MIYGYGEDLHRVFQLADIYLKNNGEPKPEAPKPKALTAADLKRGGRYNWKFQSERLVYLRKFNGWHQFSKIGDPRPVWCEVLDEDLHMLEETVDDTEPRTVAAGAGARGYDPAGG